MSLFYIPLEIYTSRDQIFAFQKDNYAAPTLLLLLYIVTIL